MPVAILPNSSLNSWGPSALSSSLGTREGLEQVAGEQSCLDSTGPLATQPHGVGDNWTLKIIYAKRGYVTSIFLRPFGKLPPLITTKYSKFNLNTHKRGTSCTNSKTRTQFPCTSNGACRDIQGLHF